MITHNKEADLHAQMRRTARLQHGVSRSVVAQWRLGRFERAVLRSSDAVVFLSEGDLPDEHKSREHATVIEPVLDASPHRWTYTGCREIFFVGNIDHCPNFLAVRWLAEQFAPALAQSCPDARIRIVGAAPDRIDRTWRRENIEFMGSCDNRALTRLFTTSDFFIGPIEHEFGAKMKVRQCLAHGTPMLATPGALSGAPQKDSVPRFSLRDPRAAAALAAELLASETRLVEQSRMLVREHARLLASRDEPWRQLLSKVKAQPLRRRSRPLMPFRWWRKAVPVDPSQPWPRKVEIGVDQPLRTIASGVYPPELMDGSPLRWTGELAELRLPLNQATLPTSLTVRLWGIAPPHGTSIGVLVNGLELFRGRVEEKGVNQTIDLPDLSGVRQLQICLASSGFQPARDARTLGVAIRSIVLSR